MSEIIRGLHVQPSAPSYPCTSTPAIFDNMAVSLQTNSVEWPGRVSSLICRGVARGARGGQFTHYSNLGKKLWAQY